MKWHPSSLGKLMTQPKVKSEILSETAKSYIKMKAKNPSNIQREGNSYRVRVQANGIRVSKNFTSLRKALQFRKQLQG